VKSRLPLFGRFGLKAFAVLALAVLATGGRPQEAPSDLAPRPLVIEARPIASFEPRDPEKKRFGALEFRGGLVLTSHDRDFGGWSALWRDPNGGGKLVALSDQGVWLTAAPVYRDGRIAGLGNATIGPVLGAKGEILARTRAYDTESLTIAPDGRACIGIERVHEVRCTPDFGRTGLLSRMAPIPVPPEVKRLPSNKSLEAVGIAPAASPLAGAVVAIAERSGGIEEPTTGFILTGAHRGTFKVVRRDHFDVTDLAFLPDGDMLILERFYAPLSGVGMRIRRIAGATIRPGAVLDGPVLIQADLGQQIDNMEGLAIHRNEKGETILTLISDDNFSWLQRTVLLEFALAGEGMPALAQDAQTKTGGQGRP
jgi:hypothetical protein